MEEATEDYDMDSLHPNWVALATVKFKPKLFVKSSGTEDQQEPEKVPPASIDVDDSASLVYKEILEMPSTARSREKPEKQTRRKRLKKFTRVPFNKESFFRLAMADDVDGIQKLFETSIDPDVNATDHFGWTALMMAACEGAANAFYKILLLGADLTIADKKGNTASSLAEKKGFSDILDIIDEFKNRDDVVEISDDEDDDERDDGTLFCKECGIEISKTSSTAHQTSTVHLFSCKFKGNTNIKSFGIAKNNLGYQMMRRTGWDGSSALGSRNNGKLYPIKTVLRKRGTGLGIKQTPAKITHFKANDPSSINYRPPPHAPTRKEIHENDQRDKRHEQRLRRALS